MKKIFILLFFIPLIGNSQTITDGLVGYWPFNGNANDESGNGHNGIVNGAVLSSDRNGNANSAYEFDGINDYIRIADSDELDGTEALTISCWFKSTSPISANAYGIISKRNGPNNEQSYSIFTWVGNGSINFDIDGIEDRSNLDWTPKLNQWYHLVMVYDGGLNYNERVKIYIDNNLNKTFKESSSSIPNYSSDIIIGGMQANSNHFNGSIDEVGIWNRALTEEEIQVLYDGQPLPTNPDLCGNLYCDGENIGIGTDNTHGYKLAVAGDIISEEIIVKLQSDWPDFVFDEDYKMKSLGEVEEYILENKHLPEMPSEMEITETGINLGEMDAKLLQKIEELTLYLIEINKDVNDLKKENKELKKENEALQNQISSLKKKK